MTPERSQRLTAMGEMAARIAHEIRNPLGSIELYASLLQRELEDARQNKMAEKIVTGVRSLDTVISNLLFYTRAPKPSLKRFSLNNFLDTVFDFVQILISQNGITLEKSLAGTDIFIQSDQELLRQVMLNVLHNAIQAMPSGGTLAASVLIEERTDEGIKGKSTWVVISLSDTGQGISSRNLKKIFNPFFTTKDHGTGLGLSIAHNILDSLCGIIEVHSTVKKGTTVCIQLPVYGS